MSFALSVNQAAPWRTEHELVAAVRQGSDRAFEELYSRYSGRIGAYVLGMVGDRGRAEDIAQEVFIAALRRIRDTERPIAFKPWIYEIAKNACVDEFRRAGRAREVSLDADDTPDRSFLSRSSTPDAAVESKQRLDDLRGAFGGLSETHHRILVLRELEGLSYGQIGARLGMSKAMVQSTLFRARRRLGKEYDELVSGRRCEQVQTAIASSGERRLRALGVRERRQLARHLAHCQPCRRQARIAGVDDSFFQAPGLIGKIAAVLPIPWLRWRRSRVGQDAIAGSGSHRIAALRSLQTAAQYADPSAPALGFGRAAATVAAIVIAGAGGGFASGLGGHDRQLGPGAGTRARPGAPPAIAPALAPLAPARARVASAGAPSPRVDGVLRAGSPTRGQLATGSVARGSGAASVAKSSKPVVHQSSGGEGSASGRAPETGGIRLPSLPLVKKAGTGGSLLSGLPALSLPKLPALPQSPGSLVSNTLGSVANRASAVVGSLESQNPLPAVSRLTSGVLGQGHG